MSLPNNADVFVTGSSIDDDAGRAPGAQTGVSRGWALRTKRAMDVTIALIALVVFGPAMILTAIAIKAQGGPALFKQKRVGKDGVTFDCFKFRSMCVNAEDVLRRHLEADDAAAKEWAENHKLTHDPRITPLGRVLRKYSIDELPQFFNVLTGDMSIVGPRPITVSETVKYGDQFRYYLMVRPGITGLWQVSGRSVVSYDQRVALDTTYVKRWSVVEDCRIMVMTVPAVVRARGAV